MFIGEYNHTIDNKKRLAIPSKFRKAFKSKAVITKGLDNCLFLYTIKEWEILAEKLSKLPVGASDARGFARMMLAGAMDVDLDRLGRILIPDYLKSYSKLNKKIVIAGLYNRLEIWDESRWNSYKQKAEESVGYMAEKMAELGI